jgi:hypothetical protein
MILNYVSTTTIQSKKDLLSWFYPNVKVKEKFTITNKDSQLVKFCKQNKNIAELVDRLDMMEV